MIDRLKLSDGRKKESKSGLKVLEIIKEAARKATKEVLKRRKAAEQETANILKVARNNAARIAAEEKAARKAAKKQKATEDAALWVAESIRALGDSVELNDQDAVAAARNICDALDWKFLKNLTGCQIEYSMDEDFSDCKKEKIKKSDDLSTLLKKMEAGKQYYVRARLCASIKDKKHCSDWSEVIRMKT